MRGTEKIDWGFLHRVVVAFAPANRLQCGLQSPEIKPLPFTSGSEENVPFGNRATTRLSPRGPSALRPGLTTGLPLSRTKWHAGTNTQELLAPNGK
jgi:hypothetical protein